MHSLDNLKIALDANDQESIVEILKSMKPQEFIDLIANIEPKYIKQMFSVQEINGELADPTVVNVFLSIIDDSSARSRYAKFRILLEQISTHDLEKIICIKIPYSGGSLFSAIAEKIQEQDIFKDIIDKCCKESLEYSILQIDGDGFSCFTFLIDHLEKEPLRLLISKIDRPALIIALRQGAYGDTAVFEFALNQLDANTLKIILNKIDANIIDELCLSLPLRAQQFAKNKIKKILAKEKSCFSANETKTLIRSEVQPNILTQSTKEHNLSNIINAVNKCFGYIPREIQLKVVNAFLSYAETGDKGLIAEVKTGEGKSLIIAMMASYQVLSGQKVDVITSSTTLAKEAVDEFKEFYSILGLTTAHNCYENKGPYPSDYKECYKADIVYGDFPHYQWDMLREVSEGKIVRMRPYQVIIADEVDSLLVDNFSDSARLSDTIAGVEFLQIIYLALWQQLAHIELKLEFDLDNIPVKRIKSILSEYLDKLLDDTNPDYQFKGKLYIPCHLKPFIEKQKSRWVHSSIDARYNYTEGRDYIIVTNDEGYEIISPVNFEHTGEINSNRKWSNGLHQFLEIKHGLRLSSESNCASFISNLSYVKKYSSPLLGLTGTLGNKATHKFMQQVYNVDLSFFPTFKAKRFNQLPSIICNNNDELYHHIVESSIDIASSGRVVLVVCKTINKAKLLVNKLHSSAADKPVNVVLYCRNDKLEHNHNFKETAPAGTIYVATNLAGRGTDIRIDDFVEAKGGLHVCLTFFSKSKRVEDQALGRASRKGQQGSGQLIINFLESVKYLKKSLNNEYNLNGKIESFEDLLHARDLVENTNTDNILEDYLPKVLLKDGIFNQYLVLKEYVRKHYKSDLNYGVTVKAKMKDIDEQWGYWVKNTLEPKVFARVCEHSSIHDDFSKFKDNILRNINPGEFSNPFNYFEGMSTTVAIDGNIQAYDRIIETDNVVAAQAYYRRGFAYISNGNNNRGQAINDLEKARNIIQSHIIPHYFSMIAIANLNPEAESSTTQLVTFLQRKIQTYMAQVNSIEFIVEQIRSAEPDDTLTPVLTDGYYEFKDQIGMTINDYCEIHATGFYDFLALNIERYKEDNIFDVICTAFIGAVQIMAGVGIGSQFSALIGSAFIAGGVNDIISAGIGVADKDFNLNKYGAQKVTSTAITIVTLGIDIIKARQGYPTKIPHTPAQKAQMIQFAKNEALQQIKRLAVNKLINESVNILTDTCLQSFEKDIYNLVLKKIKNRLSSPEIISMIKNLMAAHTSLYINTQIIALVRSHTSSNKTGMTVLRGVLARRGSSSINAVLRIYDIANAAENIALMVSRFCDDFEELTKTLTTQKPHADSNADSYNHDAFCRKISSIITQTIMNILKDISIQPAAHGLLDEPLMELMNNVHNITHKAMARKSQNMNNLPEIESGKAKAHSAIKSTQNDAPSKPQKKQADSLALLSTDNRLFNYSTNFRFTNGFDSQTMRTKKQESKSEYNWSIIPSANADSEVQYCARPAYEDASLTMDKVAGYNICDETGGKVSFNCNNGFFDNFCALRMSYVLNNTGCQIPIIKDPYGNRETVSGVNGNQYIYRRRVVTAFVHTAYGTPDFHSMEHEFTGFFQDIMSKNGVISFKFKPNFGGTATGHIDLWGNDRFSVNYNSISSEISFRELPTKNTLKDDSSRGQTRNLSDNTAWDDYAIAALIGIGDAGNRLSNDIAYIANNPLTFAKDSSVLIWDSANAVTDVLFDVSDNQSRLRNQQRGDAIFDFAVKLYETDSLTRTRMVSDAITTVVTGGALSSAATKGSINLTRRAKALQFYYQNNMPILNSIEHMRGINFSYPVQVTTIPKGANLVQYKYFDSKTGSYFARPFTPPNTLGIYPSGRSPVLFRTNRDVTALRSRAKNMTDKHSVTGWSIETKGGGVQYYIPRIKK